MSKLDIPRLRPLRDIKDPTTREYVRKSRARGRKRFPHPSHRMSKWEIEVRCPCSTPRFYRVRHCQRCGEEEAKHPAGHFYHTLLKKCTGKPY